jgi:site-specific DNA-methyltransferase (adenine-specific)
VFLREIAKRLIKGLESEIPDLQKRVDHILHKQLFGIATTELTSLVSRRTLYCSKYPNCRYSASLFDTVEGNIRFRAKKHDFVNGRCKWCGASAAQFDRDDGLESHA